MIDDSDENLTKKKKHHKTNKEKFEIKEMKDKPRKFII